MTEQTTQDYLEIPNLDCCIDPEELSEPRERFKAIAATYKELASYAEGKQHAMELRLKGKINLALKFEAACDTLYARLPDWAKTW